MIAHFMLHTLELNSGRGWINCVRHKCYYLQTFLCDGDEWISDGVARAVPFSQGCNQYVHTIHIRSRAAELALEVCNCGVTWTRKRMNETKIQLNGWESASSYIYMWVMRIKHDSGLCWSWFLVMAWHLLHVPHAAASACECEMWTSKCTPTSHTFRLIA